MEQQVAISVQEYNRLKEIESWARMAKDWLPWHEQGHPEYEPGKSDVGRNLRHLLNPEESAIDYNWNPIRNAPDKTNIIGWSKRRGFSIGTLTKYKKPEMPHRDGGWFQPSHWMALPKPPSA